jgi:hypothetical protein
LSHNTFNVFQNRSLSRSWEEKKVKVKESHFLKVPENNATFMLCLTMAVCCPGFSFMVILYGDSDLNSIQFVQTYQCDMQIVQQNQEAVQGSSSHSEGHIN